MLLSHSAGWSLSVNSIAEQNQEGRDAIRSAIKELEEFGYLIRTQVNENGQFGEAIWTTQDPKDYPMTENPMTGNPTTKNNNIKNNNIKNNKRISAQNEELFKEFWKEYPRKLDRTKALKAFSSALNRANFEDILAGAIRYKNDPNRLDEFTKYPATWLNADAWENGPLPEDKRATKRREEMEQERLMKEWGRK